LSGREGLPLQTFAARDTVNTEQPSQTDEQS
jgi:hypothetical protein